MYSTCTIPQLPRVNVESGAGAEAARKLGHVEVVVDEAVDGGDLLLGEHPRADLAVVTGEPWGRAAQLALVFLPALGQKHV